MAVAHEASHGTQWTGVCTHQDEVAALVDEGSLPSCRSTPKHEDEVVPTSVEGSDGCVCEGLPSLATMAERLMLANRKTGVQEELGTQSSF